MRAFSQIVTLLREQRAALLKQVDAIDTAIAALDRTDIPDAPLGAIAEVATDDDAAVAVAVVPSRVKAKRVLSDSHKHALASGKRKARDANDVAKGIAREVPDDSFVPAIGTRGHTQPPRLVKRDITR